MFEGTEQIIHGSWLAVDEFWVFYRKQLWLTYHHISHRESGMYITRNIATTFLNRLTLLSWVSCRVVLLPMLWSRFTTTAFLSTNFTETRFRFLWNCGLIFLFHLLLMSFLFALKAKAEPSARSMWKRQHKRLAYDMTMQRSEEAKAEEKHNLLL